MTYIQSALTYTLTRDGDAWTVLHNGEPVFTGSMSAAAAERTRLAVLASTPVKTDRKADRMEAAQRTAGGWGTSRSGRTR